jgi:aspartate/methionine/tyrosine aminotransferase
VPFFPRVAAGGDPREVLAPYLSPRSRALYFASPNNPDGAVLAPEVLASLAALARERDWWVFSDEVYAPFVYEGEAAESAHPYAPERTITSYSMSKSHALAGLRLGMMTAPAPVIGVMRRLMTHTLFQVPLYAQRLAERAITEGTDFLAQARDRYREARDLSCALLNSPRPRAGAYVFLDLSSYAQGDIWRAIDAGLDAGVSLAPGEAFGPSFQGWARLCFTAVPPEELAWGLPRLRAALEGLRG